MHNKNVSYQTNIFFLIDQFAYLVLFFSSVCFVVLAVVQIDLKGAKLKTKSKLYERIQKALSHEALSSVTLRILWKPPSDDVCPSSVAKYFADIGYVVELASTSQCISHAYSLKVPLLGTDDLTVPSNGETFFATPNELVEYAGMLALDFNFEQHDFLNSYQSYGKSKEIGSALVLRIDGFFSGHTLEKLVASLR